MINRAHVNPEVEYSVLATIMSDPKQVAVAWRYLGASWLRHFASSSEARDVASALRDLYEDGKLPDRNGVRRHLEKLDNGPAINALPVIMRAVEHGDFLPMRCDELLELTQLRMYDELGDLLKGASAKRVPDMDELLEVVQGQLAIASTQKIRLTTAAEAAEFNAQRFIQQRDNPTKITGIPTGFPKIDLATAGLQPGRPYVLGARPSHGKTALACNIADVAASAGFLVLIFAHEMDAADYTLRMAAARADVNVTRVRQGTLNLATGDRFLRATEEVKQLPVFMCDETRIAPRRCQSLALALRNSHGQGLVIVDHVQLERIPGYRRTRADEMAEISGIWLDTCKQSRHALLMLSQLNRDAAGKEPKLSELRDSGAIEQDAHGAMLLWRPGHDLDDKPANQGRLYLAKNRDGPTAFQLCHFTGPSMRFRPWQSGDKKLSRAEMENTDSGDGLPVTDETEKPI